MLKALIEMVFGEEHCVKETSLKGETVKCRGEKLIANYFYNNGINYEYDVPVINSQKKKVGTCNFYLPRYDTYIAFCGRCGEPKFDKIMAKTISKFQSKGVTFISLYPQDLNKLDQTIKNKFEKIIGKELIIVAN